MIDAKELNKIVKLAEHVPDKFQQKCFELLLQTALHGAIPEEKPTKDKITGKSQDSPKNEEEGVKPKELKLSFDVKAFLTQFKLSEEKLRQIFFVEGDEIKGIYELQTTKKSEAQIQHSLLMALQNAIKSGQFSIAIDEVRNRCSDEKSLDSRNFMKNFRYNEIYYKQVKNGEDLVLSPDGKAELAEVIERLVG